MIWWQNNGMEVLGAVVYQLVGVGFGQPALDAPAEIH